MPKVFINTIVGTVDYSSQVEFINELSKMSLDIDGIEVRGELFSENEGDRTKEFEEIIQIAETQKWDLLISYPHDLFDEEGIRTEAEDALKEAEKYGFQNAKFNTGSPEGILNVPSNITEAFINQFSTTVSIENGQNEQNGSLPAVKLALENARTQKLPLGFTYDMGNWFIMEEDPKEAFDEIKDSITLFHLKNVDAKGKTTLLDDGVVSWRELIELDIPYIIEYAMPVGEIKNEIQKLKSAFPE